MFKSIIRRWREWRWQKLVDKFGRIKPLRANTLVAYFDDKIVYSKPTVMLTYELKTGKGWLTLLRNGKPDEPENEYKEGESIEETRRRFQLAGAEGDALEMCVWQQRGEWPREVIGE